MADLYNLDAEIADYSQEEVQLERIDDDVESNEEWETDEQVELPATLREAAQQRRKSESQQQAPDGEDRRVDLEDIFTAEATTKSFNLAQDLMYTHLYKAWSQECNAPELLPFDNATVEHMREWLREQDDTQVDTGNANMDALFESLLRIDVERIKFLLADLLSRRLQKIEAYPLHMRTLTDRMSEQEVRSMIFALVRIQGKSNNELVSM